MEQVLVSSPTGRSEWEREQNPALGFLLLDPDKGATLPQGDTGSREPGLDFRKAEKELVSLSLDEILQENALCLDDLFRSSRYPWDKGAVCSVLQWETPSIPAQDFPRCMPESLSVCGGAEDLLDVSGSPCTQGSTCPQDSSEDNFSVGDHNSVGPIHFHSSSEELIDFGNTQSPLQVLASTPDSSREDLSLLETVQRLECTSTGSSIYPYGQASPQDVSAEASPQDMSTEASQQGVSTEASLQDMSSEVSLWDMSAESSQQAVSAEASQQDMTADVSPQDISIEVSTQDMSAEVSPQDMSAESSQQGVSTEASPQDLSAEVNLQDMSAESSQQAVSTEASQQDMSAEVSLPDMSAEVNLQDMSAESSQQAVSTEASPQDMSAEVSLQDMSAESSQQTVSTEVSLQDMSAEASPQGVSAEASLHDMSAEASLQDMSAEASKQGVSTEASPQDMSAEISLVDINAEASPQARDMSAESSQQAVSTEARPQDMSAEVSLVDMSAEVSLVDMSAEASQQAVITEASPQDMSAEASLVDMSAEARSLCVGVEQSQVEGGGLSPSSQGRESLSPETGDKGLFCELAGELLTLYSCFQESSGRTAERGQASSSSSSLPAEALEEEGSARLFEISAACRDRCPSLTDGEDVLLSPPDCAEIPEPGSTGPGTGTGTGTGGFSLPRPPSPQPQDYRGPPDGDSPRQGDLDDSGWGSDPDPLMEYSPVPDASAGEKRQHGLIQDQCLTAESAYNGEALRPKPPDETLCGPGSGPELHVRHSAVHVGLEFSMEALYQKQHCSTQQSQDPGSVRTSEQTLAGLSLPGDGVCAALSVGGCESQSEDELSPLRAVFSALDQDRDGFVQIEEFLQFAKAYGAEQVKDLTRFLDPSGLGVISFEDFYRGIGAIGNGGTDPQLCDVGFLPREEAPGCPEEYDDYAAFEQNEVSDSAYLGSESTYSEYETFIDEDAGTLPRPELHEEVETDSAIESALNDPEEDGRRLSLASELNSVSLVTVVEPGEEHFEDFGEGHESELLQDGPLQSEGGGGPASLVPQPSLLLSPSADPFPAGFQSFLREELLDFFCSQCHKQISRLEDLSTRLNFLEMNSTSKRLSSRKVARHLLQSGALSLGPTDELTRDILDLADTDLIDKVMYLEKRVSELEQDSASSTEQHVRLRQENLQLVHRANALEEQLKEQEARAEEDLQFEVRKQKEALGKLERERDMELENLQTRLQQLDEENCELRSCVSCLHASIERMEEEKRKLQDETENLTDRLNEELEVQRKVSGKLSHERHKSQKEKECTQELIEDLRKQLELLQLFKLEVETRSGRSTSAGLQEYQTRTREAELEQEVRRLKQDNRGLKEQNDELNGQIITLSIQGAKNLFAASFSESLAAEINSVSRDELMEAIHKQEEINYRLQDYIDRIIVAIMESNPSILEVK